MQDSETGITTGQRSKAGIAQQLRKTVSPRYSEYRQRGKREQKQDFPSENTAHYGEKPVD
jgi:hypothetical protein